jgi:hypothetical protein
VTLREQAAHTGRSLPEAAAEVASKLSLDE